MLFSCSEQRVTVEKLANPECIISQSVCSLNTQFGEIDIAFNVRALVAEEAFTLFVLPSNQKIMSVSGHLEGDDMYMGKIPLFFNELTESDYQAKSLFGSCAQDKMRWKIWLKFDGIDENGNSSSQTVFLTVDSYRNYQTYLNEVDIDKT